VVVGVGSPYICKVKSVFNSDPLSKDESISLVRDNQDKLQLSDKQFQRWAGKRYIVLIDVINTRDIKLSHLRNYFGLVLQDIFMFSGDIKYNILLNSELEEKKMVKYAEYVNANQFISRLKNKYKHVVSEGGSNLSMGQRQLIAFARALAKEPQILILDEATSSIDSETEYLIQDAISKIMKERTSIAIAHRLSTIQKVDRIYVMNKGKIVESGSHAQLLAKKGHYFELYKFQYLKT